MVGKSKTPACAERGLMALMIGVCANLVAKKSTATSAVGAGS
jgi:hypothetical protein